MVVTQPAWLQKGAMMKLSYDVVVIGGGTAGVIAATQAGRAGAATLLVEKTGLLGGTVTSGAVNFPGLFHAWGHQIIAGIGWDLVSRCVAEAGGLMPDFSAPPEQHWQQQVRVDRAVFAALCDEWVLGAGAELLLHAMVAAVAEDGDGWRVTLCGKGGLEDVRAAVLVDCTGDANAVAVAGCRLVMPDVVQPATLIYHVSGYDLAALDVDTINRRFEERVRRGELAYTDIGWNTGRADVGAWLAKHGSTANHVCGINARDSAGKTALEVEARRSFLRLYRFLKTQPGLHDLRIDFLAPECGVRETVTIVGKRTVTAGDYTSGRLWDDAVCYSFYPIDVHTADGSGLDCRPLRPGVVPAIPRGAMLPEGSRNLVVAGRCISSDRPANSALRVQATCMATGQAAGAMAALAARTGVDVESVPMEDVRALLREHGAIVPG
jgi:hypothetical protein